MKRKSRNFNIFTLSFLDVISCGFGAVVLLVLISRNADAPSGEDANIAQQLLNQVLAAETRVENLSNDLEDAETGKAAKAALSARLNQAADEMEHALRDGRQDLDKMARDREGLALVEKTLKRAAIKPATAKARDDEVGGIPVDSDYVVFIIDTSGSMQDIWPQVVREIENIINIHPAIKGFQILNDNGALLMSTSGRKWIPDSPSRRRSVIKLLKTWRSGSNSSPVEGLEIAIKRYVRVKDKVSIYIFGDDYTGGSFDPVIRTLDTLNANRITGKPLARVHAVGFLGMPGRSRFATLMREVTRRNNGTFVALPN